MLYNHRINTLNLVQSLLAILLVVLVLIQNRGGGLGSSWGGISQMYTTRRGVDKLLFRATILTSVLFVVVSFAAFLA